MDLRHWLLFFSLGVGFIGFAQSPLDIESQQKRKTVLDHLIMIQGNISENSSLEIGYSLLKLRERSFGGFSFSGEHYLGDDYRMALKPRAFYSAMNIQVGVSVPYVFDFEGSQEVYFKPEVGLTVGWAYIVYSNNIPFMQEEVHLIPTHNIGIGINFLWGTFE